MQIPVSTPNPRLSGPKFSGSFLLQPGDLYKHSDWHSVPGSFSTPFLPIDGFAGHISCDDSKDVQVASFLAGRKIPFKYTPTPAEDTFQQLSVATL